MSKYQVTLKNEEYTSLRYSTPFAFLKNEIALKMPHVILKMDPEEIVTVVFGIKQKSSNHYSGDQYIYNQEYGFKILFNNHLHIMCPNYTYRITCRLRTVDNESIFLFEHEIMRVKESIELKNVLNVKHPKEIEYQYITFDIRRFHNEQNKQKNDLTKLNFLNEFLLNGHYTDVVITVDDKILNAHKYVLSQQSQVFKNMFDNDMLEKQNGKLKIDDFDASVVQEMLLYMYTFKTEKLNAMAIELFKIAHKYEIDALKNKCMEFFMFNVNSENVVSILELAELYELHDLVHKLRKFIMIYEKDVIKTFEYQEYLYNNLNIGTVASILVLCEKYLELKDFKSKIFSYVKEHIKKILRNEKFLNLFVSHPELMRELITYVHK